ncbi:AraC family transcriptional regulator [Cystobacter ferrugineus]|uniref:AraC family transcriptional regulator n=1 Tax=Cystobacter ferrugineus TaxID=83449 RepID=A0A1L9BHS0_9BACT|nr:AraC family transcriptional regulator [Cystobacter ferrugineus]OJH41779.1 AraC family transcriptional regulator [Cystobacter ferrugineus]
MSVAPKKLSERPAPVEQSAADVLADVLDSMRLTTLMHGGFDLGAPWGLRFPGIEAAHLIVVGQGRARLELDGERTPSTLAAGDLALLPLGGSYSLRDAEGSPLHVLGQGECERNRTVGPIRVGGDGDRTRLVTGSFQFGTTSRAPLFKKLPRVLHVAADDPDAASSLASTVQLLLAESASPRPGTTVIMARLAEILLVQALRTHVEKPGLCSLVDPPIAKALALIHERPAEDWSVERLATAVALSRSGFAARFSTIVGDPPLEYLARWRMTKAAQSLRETALSLGEIARQVGYQSEASFNRAFKRWEGVAPGTYRRERRPRLG